MQLTPLQSRLAASVIASCLLIIIYFSLFSPHFALALELEHRSPIIFDDGVVLERSQDSLDGRGEEYEPDFAAFERSIMGRAPAGVVSLVNNQPVPLNLEPDTTQVFVFESTEIFGRAEDSARLELRGEHDGIENEIRDVEKRDIADIGDEEEEEAINGVSKRQSTKKVYISANTCLQPQRATQTDMDPPQLTLYVATSSKNQSPGPDADMGQQQFRVFTEGAVMYEMETSGDIYLSISAPSVATVFSGTYNFQVAVSVDAYYHSYDDSSDADLIWVDSDASSALLMTHNLTDSQDSTVDDEIMSKEPYVMFAQNAEDVSINGLQYSYCGLTNYAQIAAVNNGKFASMVTTGMTKRGAGNLPKQQFYFSGLNASSSYQGILANNTNSSTTESNVVGGGGHVFRATNFTTKSVGGNCAVVFNLTFCDQVAYAVPSNPSKNTTELSNFYDDYAKSMYGNFEKVLAQIPCNTSSTQRYSLVRDCDDCAAAYKAWLCSVTIPRCEDFSATDDWLQPRAITQPFPDGSSLAQDVLSDKRDMLAFTTSRNPLIDEVIKPGPYKEVLPCEDLCYTLVQSCPAAMGFSCPQPGMTAFNTSYGRRTKEDANGVITCNYPGSAHFFSSSVRASVPWVLLSAATGLLAVVLL
ncbi:Calcium influx-promoting protein ehs1 [Pleurostoma richardsiae]|uniref:Calcium influx-promoting protein ehs1 n=1 Tax=Pleurostoma richardsiae TaxID=41990 RepID=A0AA38RMP2_9PEZI|nr:Calcium influx-promoting protein ehs1 [Pleurostoma richardsiae]